MLTRYSTLCTALNQLLEKREVGRGGGGGGGGGGRGGRGAAFARYLTFTRQLKVNQVSRLDCYQLF